MSYSMKTISFAFFINNVRWMSVFKIDFETLPKDRFFVHLCVSFRLKKYSEEIKVPLYIQLGKKSISIKKSESLKKDALFCAFIILYNIDPRLMSTTLEFGG